MTVSSSLAPRGLSHYGYPEASFGANSLGNALAMESLAQFAGSIPARLTREDCSVRSARWRWIDSRPSALCRCNPFRLAAGPPWANGNGHLGLRQCGGHRPDLGVVEFQLRDCRHRESHYTPSRDDEAEAGSLLLNLALALRKASATGFPGRKLLAGRGGDTLAAWAGPGRYGIVRRRDEVALEAVQRALVDSSR